MSNNQELLTAIIVYLAVFTIIGLLLMAWTFRKESVERATRNFERALGLGVPDELRFHVGARRMRRRRFELGGTILAVIGTAALVWFADPAEAVGGSGGAFLVVGAALGGGAVGSLIGALQWPAQRDPEAIRYARAGAVGLPDYIPPFERRGAPIIVGLAILLLGITAITDTTGITSISLSPTASAGSVLTIASVLALGFSEIVGRRIVGRAQPIGSERELVWDDALRSQDLLGLASAPMVLGFFAVMILGTDLSSVFLRTIDPVNMFTIDQIGGVLAIVAVTALAGYWIASRPERYFLRRLWPKFINLEAPLADPPYFDRPGARE